MFDADHFNTTFTNFSDQMFVKDKRDEAFLKIKSGSKKHLFLKDLMWGKAARAKQAFFEQKRLDELKYQEQRQRSIMARLQSRHSPTSVHDEKQSDGGNNRAKAKVPKNRFVQERQLGKIETEKDGYVASRYVQPATTKNAGKLAPWSAANPLSSEKAYSAQVFPLWDEETVRKNISNQYLRPHKSTTHDDGQQQVQEDQLPSINASDARTETTSWSLQKYGVGTELSVSAASAIVLAMKYNLSICCFTCSYFFNLNYAKYFSF